MSVLNKRRSPTQRYSRDTLINTHEGGVGRKAGAEEELSMLVFTTFLGDSFYESGDATLTRMRNLVAQVDPEFVTQLARVARKEFNMRATPAALLGLYTLLEGQPKDGRVIRDVFQRGDEIGDYLATVSLYADNGKVIPSAVRFGRRVIHDQLNERQALRYNNFSRNWNLAKILRLVHARAEATESQKALYDFIISWKQEGSQKAAWEKLAPEARALLPVIERAVNGEDEGSVSWERSRSAGSDWTTLLPDMGYMALIRNLRNFLDDVPASNKEFWNTVISRISSETEVSRSKQLPFRFLSAFNAVHGHRSHAKYHALVAALEEGLDHSVGNIPTFKGRTLVVVDTSGSMDGTVSDKSEMSFVQIASLFGAAMFRAQDAEVVAFGTHSERVKLDKNSSVLNNQAEIMEPRRRMRLGYGTNLGEAFTRVNVRDFQNIVVFSDMQIHDSIGHALGTYPGHVYSVNLRAYEAQMQRVGSKHFSIGGWSDATLKLMSLLSDGNLVKYIRDY